MGPFLDPLQARENLVTEKKEQGGGGRPLLLSLSPPTHIPLISGVGRRYRYARTCIQRIPYMNIDRRTSERVGRIVVPSTVPEYAERIY